MRPNRPVLKLLLGDGASVVLEGQCVKPARVLEEKKFVFEGQELEQVLRRLVS